MQTEEQNYGTKRSPSEKETVNGSVFIRESLRMIPSVLLAASFSSVGFTALTSL